MFTQLTWRSHSESRPPTGANFCRQRVLLAAVSLLLIVAPFVESQEQPAKQRPKPGRVKLIETVTGNKNPTSFLTFTNGGKTLVSISNERAKGTSRELEIKSWDVAARKVTATISQPEASLAWAISPDGNTVAVGWFNGRDTPTKTRLYDLRGVKKPQDIQVDDVFYIRAVAFSSDGQTLAWMAGSQQVMDGVQRRIRLWTSPPGS